MVSFGLIRVVLRYSLKSTTQSSGLLLMEMVPEGGTHHHHQRRLPARTLCVRFLEEVCATGQVHRPLVPCCASASSAHFGESRSFRTVLWLPSRLCNESFSLPCCGDCRGLSVWQGSAFAEPAASRGTCS